MMIHNRISTIVELEFPFPEESHLHLYSSIFAYLQRILMHEFENLLFIYVLYLEYKTLYLNKFKFQTGIQVIVKQKFSI